MMSYLKAPVLPKIKKVVVETYNFTKTFPETEKYALASQMERAAFSILSNFAEGFGRGSRKEVKHHLTIARGSACELDAQLSVLPDIGYAESTQDLRNLLDRIVYELNLIINKYGKGSDDDQA